MLLGGLIECMKRANLAFLILLLLSVANVQPSIAEGGWEEGVDSLAVRLVSGAVRGKMLTVADPVEGGEERIYLPFSRQIRSQLVGALREHGAQITSDPFSAEASVVTEFHLVSDGLLLESRIVDFSGAELVSGKSSLPYQSLPDTWDRRTLRNIAYELAGKIDEILYGGTLNTLLVGLSGGESEYEEFVSDFTIAINDYMREELGKIESVVIRRASENSRRIHQLQGKFRISGEKIRLTYTMTRVADGEVVALVSTRFPLEIIPQRMSIYPDNRSTAVDFVDEPVGGVQKIPVAVWVNQENGVYRNGDRLVVTVRPDIDTYVRVFYVMSDGSTCQIQPSTPGESTFLEGGIPYMIGGADDDV